MTASWIYILVVAVFLAVSLYLYVATLKFGLKWAGVADISYVKAFGLWILFVLLAATVLAITFMSFSIELLCPLAAILEITTRFVVSSLVVTWIYKSNLQKSAKAMLPNSLVGIALIAAIIFIFRPFIYESFEISTNAMCRRFWEHILKQLVQIAGPPPTGTPRKAVTKTQKTAP